MGFKMKGHTLPGPNQRKSPAKHSPAPPAPYLHSHDANGIHPDGSGGGGGGRTPPLQGTPMQPMRSKWTDKAEKIH